MSPIKPFPSAAGGNQVELCPFLGLPTDTQTSLSYPSSWNVCHHTKPVGTPRLEFQRSFCFSKEYSTCPIFNRSDLSPLPRGIRFPVSKAPIQISVSLPVLVAWVLLFLGIVGTLWAIQASHNPGGGLPEKTASSIPSATKVILPTKTPPPTDTPVTPSITTEPTQPATSTPTGPTTRPTDTLWPTRTPTQTPTNTITPTTTQTPTNTPTRTDTPLPTATATFPPTWTPRPTDTLWPVFTPTRANRTIR